MLASLVKRRSLASPSRAVILLSGAVLLTAHAAAADLPSGELLVLSDPPGAAVVIDGQEMRNADGKPEVTPWGPARLAEGPHSVSLHHPRFSASPQRFRVDVVEGLTSTVRASWTGDPSPRASEAGPPSAMAPRAARVGSLAIDSEPAGAAVFIDDGELQGRTPLVLRSLGEGPHRVRLELPGAAPYATTVRVIAGATAREKVLLTGEHVAKEPVRARLRAPYPMFAWIIAGGGGLAALVLAVRFLLTRYATRIVAPIDPFWSHTPAAPSTSHHARKLVVGDFEIRWDDPAAVLAVSAIAAVYKGARRSGKQEPVAIKILHDNPPKDGNLNEALGRAGPSTSALDDEHIIRVHDAGTTGQGLAYIVMEYVEGDNLQGLIAKGLHVYDAVDIAIQICLALAAAHTVGICHGDVKPTNILVRDGRQPYRIVLADFGRTRAVRGAPAYMAPEIMEEQPTASSDLYSLGVVLFEMLAQRRPFEGPTDEPFELMRLHATCPVPSLDQFNPDVPPELGAIVMNLLAKQPEDRYRSAEAAIDALRAVSPTASGSPRERRMRAVATT